MSVRPLAIMLGFQLVLVACVLAWAAQGFPLPHAITGPGAPPRSAPHAAGSGAARGVGAAGAALGSGAAAGVAAAAAATGNAAPRANVNRFDGVRAFALLREQVRRYGYRPAGSPALRRLARRLRALLPN